MSTHTSRRPAAADTEAASPRPTEKARLEARIDVDLDELITSAARARGVSKTAFVSEAVREAALKVVARADVMLMDPQTFDTMMASLETPDRSPELEALAAMPRRISQDPRTA